MEADKLYLHEALLLLALKDEEGTTEFGVSYHNAMGGAILAELVLQKRVSIDESKRNKKVILQDTTLFGDPVLDECLGKIREKKKPESPMNWVMRFASLKNLKHRVAERLVWKGILRVDEDKVMLIFKRKIYPEVNHEPERQIIEQMREVVLSDSPPENARAVVLVALAKVTDILKVVLDKNERKSRKARLKEIEKGEIAGVATREAIEAMQAAVAVSVAITTSVAATTAATS